MLFGVVFYPLSQTFVGFGSNAIQLPAFNGGTTARSSTDSTTLTTNLLHIGNDAFSFSRLIPHGTRSDRVFLSGFLRVRTCKTLPASTNVVAILGVLRAEEGDEVFLVSIKLRTGLNVREQGVDGEGFTTMLTHGVKKTRASVELMSSRPELFLKVFPQVSAFMLSYVIFPSDVIDDQVDEHFSTSHT